MDPMQTLEEGAQQVLKTLFRMCRDTRLHQQNVSDLARQIPMDFASAKRIIAMLEREGYLETLTFGQKVAFTDAGLVIAQRLIR
jgi:Mn-dependent DtxR family transcriptional regulator